MMGGGDWYQHQAFRAYNQALGRCIRHQHDYSCIFLVRPAINLNVRLFSYGLPVHTPLQSLGGAQCVCT